MSTLSSIGLGTRSSSQGQAGKHAAERSGGPLAQVVDGLPTAQEILLWEQTRRYRSFDRIEDWWFRRGRSIVIVAFLATLTIVGGVIGAHLPVG